jgi:anti-sigma B factor antagonist
MTDDYLRIRRAPNGEAEILHVGGELDIGSAPILERALAAEASIARNGVIYIDLRGLSFIDSTGARTMWNMHQTAEAHGQRLIYASAGPQVRQVLGLLGLDETLNLTP